MFILFEVSKFRASKKLRGFKDKSKHVSNHVPNKNPIANSVRAMPQKPREVQTNKEQQNNMECQQPSKQTISTCTISKSSNKNTQHRENVGNHIPDRNSQQTLSARFQTTPREFPKNQKHNKQAHVRNQEEPFGGFHVSGQEGSGNPG